MLDDGTELGELIALAELLSRELQIADQKTIAPLAKQYRETICEIERMKGMGSNDDEIDEILSEREADGKPGAIRQDRSTV